MADQQGRVEPAREASTESELAQEPDPERAEPASLAQPEQPPDPDSQPEQHSDPDSQPIDKARETEPAHEVPHLPAATRAEEPATSGEGRGSQRFRAIAPSGARRLWRAVTKRPQASHVGVGALVCLLSFAAMVQVRGDEEDALANARRDELLQIYDGLSRQGDRLEDEIQELRQDREDLISSADSEGVALEQAQERIRQLEVIAGVAPTTGPGIQVTITDPEYLVGANDLLAAVVELRSAGAEAIQIEGVGNGETVRVVADTYFLPAEEGVVASGVLLQPTYVITAIGEPESLDEAMNFPRGLVSSVQNDNNDQTDATVTQFNELTVDVLHEVEEPEYLSPAPEDE